MSNRLETYTVNNWTVLGCTYFRPPFKVSDELINEARLVHVVNGHSRLHSANQQITLESGDTLIMKADNFINDWLENDSDQINQVIVFQLNSDFLQYLYANELPKWLVSDSDTVTNAIEKVVPSTLLTSFFDNLQHYLDHPEYLNEELVVVKIRELISILIQSSTSDSIQNIFANLFKSNEYKFQEVILKNTYENLSINDLAFLTGMSLSSFKRKFSAIYGTSPNKYIISKRLEKAQVLLNTTDLHISEIAFDCGFSDLSYFSKTFKRYYHTSPSDIRKNN